MSRPTNKQNQCLTKTTYRKLLVSDAGFDALGTLVSVQSVSISELLSDLFPVRAGHMTAVLITAGSVDDFYGQNFQVRPSTGRCSGR